MDKLRLQIKEHIVNRQLKKALQLAQALPNIDCQNELIVLESRLTDSNSRLASGLILQDDYACEINNIALAILNLTDDGVSYEQPMAFGAVQNIASVAVLGSSQVVEQVVTARLVHGEPRQKDFIITINGEAFQLSLYWGWFRCTVHINGSQVESRSSFKYLLAYDDSLIFKIKTKDNIVHKGRFLIETSRADGAITLLKIFINETEIYHLA